MGGLGSYLGWATAQCRPVPRELWPPVLFHGGPAGQTKLKMRAPAHDYSAIYASSSIEDPVSYGKVKEHGVNNVPGWPIGPGEVYVIVPHRLPREAVIRRGSEGHEWVIVTCSGEVPFHDRFDWRAIKDMTPMGEISSRFYPQYYRVSIKPFLRAFFADLRGAAPGTVALAEDMLTLVPAPKQSYSGIHYDTVNHYAVAVEERTVKFFCGVRQYPRSGIKRTDLLQEMACKAARKGKYTPNQLELWPE